MTIFEEGTIDIPANGIASGGDGYIYIGSFDGTFWREAVGGGVVQSLPSAPYGANEKMWLGPGGIIYWLGGWGPYLMRFSIASQTWLSTWTLPNAYGGGCFGPSLTLDGVPTIYLASFSAYVDAFNGSTGAYIKRIWQTGGDRLQDIVFNASGTTAYIAGWDYNAVYTLPYTPPTPPSLTGSFGTATAFISAGVPSDAVALSSAFDPTVPIAPPTTAMTYQGQLTNPTTGQPLANGQYSVTFAVYNVASGGTAMWTSSSVSVTTTGGVFSTIVNIPVYLFTSDVGRWLEVGVGGETLSPRMQICSTPFTVRSFETILP